ncbi:leishmanolysin-like peptidase [Anolis carolinensis]|uniref:Leishmanolysin-like peptidase n=1 Tax=Anolis carolinensis TaxID=28377 RepID=G1KJC1_ANOCA|nr:PREDICTED: leishmanolysin-like peptidase [Anolis carolinensis]|eukprot:XP_003214925.1 PREDICTED: leishmanolysin-like peptidase [Anolis carolinensis]
MAAGRKGRGVQHLPRPLAAFPAAFAALLLLSNHRALALAAPSCHHRVPGTNEVIYKVYLKENHVMKRNADQQLRIKTVYDRSVEDLLPEKKHLIKNKIFPQAISYLEKTFQVRKPAGTVLLSRQCVTNQYLRKKDDPHRYCRGACAEYTRCGPVIVPEEHLQQCRVCSENGWLCGPVGDADKEGVQDADFVLYVSALTTERCGQENIIAYAAYCQLEANMDRPIAGYANLCPNMISTQAQEFVGMLSTVKHEIIHALGFSAGLFAFYRDDDGKPLTARYANGLPAFNESLGVYQWSQRVVRNAVRLWDVRGNNLLRHNIFLLITPKVVEEARKHFDCPILEGMELENQGGMGTELNHWEKRLLENEAMTGSHTQNRVFSRITLALMEDTGWYRANYSMAEKLDWGRDKGCDFVMKSCKFWIDNRRRKKELVAPYCDTLRSNPLQLTCRQDHRAVAVCNLQKFPQQLPQEYQYFDSLYGVPSEDLPYYGGSVEIADYCPFSQEFSWHLSGEFQRSSDCRILENQPDPFKNYGAEKYGPNSVCLIQKSAFVMEQCRKKLSYPDWGSGCYQVSCSAHGLTVWVKDMAYLCSRSGQILPVNIQMNGWVHIGNLICPACLDFCDICPPEQDPPPPMANLTKIASLDLCSCSPSLVVTLWLLMANLLPLLAGFLLCAWS